MVNPTRAAIRRLNDRVRQQVTDTGTIHAIDGDRVDLRIGTSPNVIRNVQVAGSVESLAVGQTVAFTRVDGRPLVLAGGGGGGGGISSATYLTIKEGMGELPDHQHTGTGDGGLLTNYVIEAQHAVMGKHTPGVNIPHDDHGLLTGLADDDHIQYLTTGRHDLDSRHSMINHHIFAGLADDDHNQYVHNTISRSITAQHTFNVAGAPFMLGSGAQHQTIAGLKADELNKSVLTSTGLLGGGALTADRTLSVDQQYAFAWTGAHSFAAATHFNGMVNLNNTTNAHDILPAATDSYDLGSSTKLWRKGWLSELDAILFAKNTITLLGGWLIVSKNEGKIGTAVLVGDTVIDFGQAMAANDMVLLRAAGAVEYMKIVSGAGGTRYNVTRNLDGSGANDWPDGSVYCVLGKSGDGRIELNAYDTPRISIIEQGLNYNDQAEKIRIGDMRDVFGTGANTRYGIGIGDYTGGNYLSYNAESSNTFVLKAGTGSIKLDGQGMRLYGTLSQGTINGEPYYTTKRVSFMDNAATDDHELMELWTEFGPQVGGTRNWVKWLKAGISVDNYSGSAERLDNVVTFAANAHACYAISVNVNNQSSASLNIEASNEGGTPASTLSASADQVSFTAQNNNMFALWNGEASFSGRIVAPLSVVSQINADELDGYHASAFSLTSHTHTGRYHAFRPIDTVKKIWNGSVPPVQANTQINLTNYGVPSGASAVHLILGGRWATAANTAYAMITPYGSTSSEQSLVLSALVGGQNYWVNGNVALYNDSIYVTIAGAVPAIIYLYVLGYYE